MPSFRPLTGKLVLIVLLDFSDSQKYTGLFPSPYGEVGFNRIKVQGTCHGKIPFPSPYGEVGFNLDPLATR